MTKVRATEWDAGTKTRYIQESDGKLTINNQQNLNPLLERNKRLYTSNDGYTASKDMRRVASVPPIILQLWTKEYNGITIGGLFLKKFKRKLWELNWIVVSLDILEQQKDHCNGNINVYRIKSINC